jgi:L-asparaginase II
MHHLDCVPLVEVTRGEIIESIHHGAFVVVRSDGSVVSSQGNINLLTYPRSSMKPLQALPIIETGTAEAFNLTDEEIAIFCASHTGTDMHRHVLEGIHQKIGLRESDLNCGVHWPADATTREAMKMEEIKPTAFCNNCSGKHTGMLAQAAFMKFDLKDYLNPQHPVQVKIKETLAEMVGMDAENIPLGIDGCTAPIYGVPMVKMAQAIALMAEPRGLDPDRAFACKRIIRAMMSFPIMVAGPGTFDTDLMLAAKGKVFSKGGAEGYQVLGVMPGAVEKGSPGFGIAIKIADGDSRGRARQAVSLAILTELGVLTEDELKELKSYGNVSVKNWREIEVGKVRHIFEV